MIEVGKMQELVIQRITKPGAYLNTAEKDDVDILLPTKEIPSNSKPGDKISVFVYRDSEDRLISTVRKPYAQVGQLVHLKVKSNTKIGAFMDIGLERDILMPFSETIGSVEVGKNYLVRIYVDKTDRLAASMMIRNSLKDNSPYKKDDIVTGTIYSINREHGIFVAVDEEYDAMIPKEEIKGIFDLGETIEARVKNVNDDGKLVLSLREKAYRQMNEDSEIILDILEDNGGMIGIGDKSSPEDIKEMTGLTKSAFKRAVGKLYKEGDIVPGPYKTTLK
ncbi:MAG: S1 RNA-binding domain-containing protein [Tissierellia bacterium]|nr:S1 RNA-binding domain-containing protein [Tissierellia bacterium]